MEFQHLSPKRWWANWVDFPLAHSDTLASGGRDTQKCFTKLKKFEYPWISLYITVWFDIQMRGTKLIRRRLVLSRVRERVCVCAAACVVCVAGASPACRPSRSPNARQHAKGPLVVFWEGMDGPKRRTRFSSSSPSSPPPFSRPSFYLVQTYSLSTTTHSLSFRIWLPWRRSAHAL